MMMNDDDDDGDDGDDGDDDDDVNPVWPGCINFPGSNLCDPSCNLQKVDVTTPSNCWSSPPAATATQIVTQELVPLKSATEGRALIGWCTISKSQGLKCERHRQHVKDPDIAHDWNILKLIQTQMLQIYLFGTARVLKPRVLSPKGALSDATSFQAGTQRLSTFQSIERAFRHSATNRST
jgi:hypothetical protein